MRRTTFDEKRDQHTADYAADPVDVVGRCSADGCPNIWTTSQGMLCQWHHAEKDRHLWPYVTAELRREITDRAFAKQNEPPVNPVTLAEKKAILAKLRGLFQAKALEHPKAWAHALRDREQAGERLSLAQRTMWRAALASGIEPTEP